MEQIIKRGGQLGMSRTLSSVCPHRGVLVCAGNVMQKPYARVFNGISGWPALNPMMSMVSGECEIPPWRLLCREF